jgi:DNA-binding phage protein
MPLETISYDSAAVLDSEEAIAAYLNEALHHGDLPGITHALGVEPASEVTPAAPDRISPHPEGA